MPTLANVSIKDNSNWTTMLNMIYPVGSYYISNSSTSPSSLFGGSWVAVNDSKFLLPSTGIWTAGSTQITVGQLPKHSHKMIAYSLDDNWPNLSVTNGLGTNALFHTSSNYAYGWQRDHLLVDYWNSADTQFSDGSYGSWTGNGEGYWPPYHTVYCWYRTA